MDGSYCRATEIMYEGVPDVPLLQMPSIHGVSNKVQRWEPCGDDLYYIVETSLSDEVEPSRCGTP